MNLLFILADILQFEVVGVDFTFKTRSKDPVQRRSTPLNTELDHRRICRVLALVVCGWVPKLDNVVTTCRHHICNGLLIFLHCHEVGSNERATRD